MNILKNGKLLWLLKIAITGVFVYLVNKSLSAPLIRIAEARFSCHGFLVVFCLGAAGLVLQVARWKLICTTRAIPLTGVSALKTMLFGNLLAFVTPGKLGELFRGVSLPQVKKSDTVIAVCVEKVYDAGACVLCGVSAAVIHALASGVSFGQIVIGAGSSALVIAAAGLFFLVKNRRAVDFFRMKRMEKAVSWIPDFFKNTGGLQIACIALYSLAVHLLLIAQTAFLFHLCGSADFFADVLCAAEAYAFMMLFPLFIANMGIREYSFQLFLAKLHGLKLAGMSVSVMALFCSLSILFVNLILPAVAGLAWWFFDEKTPLKKNMQAEIREGA